MRSLADDLRRRDDEELGEFIPSTGRCGEPDSGRHVWNFRVVLQLPHRFVMPLRSSLVRELRVLIALAVADQPASADVVLVPVEQQAELLRIVQRLWAIGMVWGPRPEDATSEVHVVTAARDAMVRNLNCLPPKWRESIFLRPITTSELLPLANTLDGQGGQHALAAVTSPVNLG